MSEEGLSGVLVASLEDRLKQNNILHSRTTEQIKTFSREVFSGKAELNKRQFHKKIHDIRDSCLTTLKLGADTILRIKSPLPNNARPVFVGLINYVNQIDNLLDLLDCSCEKITDIIPIITQDEIFGFYQGQYHELTENINLLSEDTDKFYTQLLEEIELEHLARIGAEIQILRKDSSNHYFNTIVDLVCSEIDKSIKFIRSTLSGERNVYDYNVSYLINQNIQSAEQMLKKNSINVNTYIASDVNKLSIDQFDFDRIFFNLLTNAIKYSRTKDEPPEESKDIDVYAFIAQKKQTDYLTIMIIDSGIGVNDEEASKIFSYQYMIADERISCNLKRTGVGLNNVKEIIEELGGEVFYINRQKLNPETKGSIFGIRIPCKKDSASIFAQV